MAQIMCAFNASKPTDERLILLSEWVDEHTPFPVREFKVASEDASFRRYFRIRHKHGSLIAMDAPPQNESVGPWLDVARRLKSIGVAAPEIVAFDQERGFVLLGDLGAETYLAHLDAGGDANRLYGDAIHVLVSMQSRLVTTGLPVYDNALLVSEMEIFREWLLARHLNIVLDGSELKKWHTTLEVLAAAAVAQPFVFVHRDYHSRNLMTGRPGAPGVLDFQDAIAGPITYDVVSLLKDCYVSWPAERVAGWVTMYLDLLRQTRLAERVEHMNDGDWMRAFALMGVQRHMKASGIFARLWHRDGKPGYLKDVPRTLGYITSCADLDERLDWLRTLIGERVLPALAASET